MKSKLRLVVMLVLIFGTLILSNVLMDFVSVSEEQYKMIENSFLDSNYTVIDNGGSKVVKLNDLRNVQAEYENVKLTLDAPAIDIGEISTGSEGSSGVDEVINNNEDLKFFEKAKSFEITYPIEYFDNTGLDLLIDEAGIKNIGDMDSLENVKFKILVDSYYVKELYGYGATSEEKSELQEKLVKDAKDENKDTLDDLESLGIEADIEIEFV